ncbi:MAG: hypothetical protein RR672_13775, partial [Raoultibacter sp.]
MMLIQERLLKKVLACVVSLALVMGFVPTAFADQVSDDATKKDTIQNVSPDQDDTSAEVVPEATSDGAQEQRSTSEITDEQIADVMADVQDDASVDMYSLEAEPLAAIANPMQEFSGVNRYDTAAQQALYGWSSSRV